MKAKPIIPVARLIDIQNVTGLQVFPLKGAQTTIGRSPSADFTVSKDTISGIHARIEYRGDDFYLIDNGSTNKTRLNGKILSPQEPAKLLEGDEIMLDIYRFIFVRERRQRTEEPAENHRAGSATPAAAETADAVAPEKETGIPPGMEKISKYEIIGRLGKGGFGSVWKARDPKGSIVAVKLLNPEKMEDERAVRKFFHEAIILSHLDHPNIAKFIDFFPYGKEYVIVMDYVSGTDLKTLLKKANQQPLTFDLGCKIAEQVLDAFQYANEKRILHRDIKPENIILDTHGIAKVMDFGVAKMSSATTQKTAYCMFSPLYTPPERFDPNSEVDVRSDIYSLGLVFYEIFTGRHPISETNPAKIIFAHTNELFDPPSRYADLPRNMSQAISKALEKDPGDRFQDFKAFKGALLGQHTPAGSAQKPSPAASPPPPPAEAPGSAVPPPLETVGAKIEVTPAFFQVGSAVMGYFADTIKNTKRKDSRFTIEQEGPILRLTVESPDGDRRIIEKNMELILKAAKTTRRP